MNITKAIAGIAGGYPVLDLEIDGHSAYVFEPKQTLLAAGLVVLLDDNRFWEGALAEQFNSDDGRHIVLLGATRNPQIVALVRRLIAGDSGNLLGS